MILSAECGILKGREQFDQMVAFVRTATADGRTIDAVERGLWERLLALGHAMLGSFVAGVGAGERLYPDKQLLDAAWAAAA